MTALTLEDIQSFINFVNANIGTKAYTLQPPATWNSGAGRPLVSSGSGYGVQLGDFPSVPVTSVNGLTGAVVLDKSHIGLPNVPDVNCTNAANITTGLLPLSVIPAAALERLVHVADEAARFLLTIAEVQNGDVVQQDDTGIMYKVVDDVQLGNAAGYNQFTAGIAAAVNWSGILSVPSNISDMASATSLEKNTWLYAAGAWTSVPPAAARANLDIPVKGTWDMSPVGTVVYPPLDADVAGGGLLVFPSITLSGKRHALPIPSGTYSAAYMALSARHTPVVTATGNTSDLVLPVTAGVQSALLFEVSNAATAPLDAAGQVIVSCVLQGRDHATSDSYYLSANFRHDSSGFFLYINTINVIGGVSNVSWGTPVSIALPAASTRIVLYFDVDTRQVGWLLDGVDQGFIALVVSSTIEEMGVSKSVTWNTVEVADLSVGAEIGILHSVTPSDIVETSPLSPFVDWVTIPSSTSDPLAPAGVEVSNRFLVSAGGSFNGVSAQTGDMVEFLSPTDIFVYPEASSVVREAMLALYATTGALDAVQGQVNGLSDAIGAVQGDILDIQEALTSVDNRSAREKFLASGSLIVGFSSTGDDLDAGIATGNDGVIVSRVDASGSFVVERGAFHGMIPGAIAYRVGDAWSSFQPVPGDEYLYAVRTYVDAISAYVPVLFKATYLGLSPKSYFGIRDGANNYISRMMVNGDQDRTPLLRDRQPALNSLFEAHGWRLNGQVLAPNAERVRQVLTDTPSSGVFLDPMADAVTVISLDPQDVDGSGRLRLIINLPANTDTAEQPDAEYEYAPVGATKESLVNIVVSPSFLFADFEVTVGYSRGGVLPETPVASYRFMPKTVLTAPSSAYMSLAYRVVPAQSEAGVGPGFDTAVEVRRLDSNSAVVYSTPVDDWSQEVRGVEVMHLDGALDLAGRIRMPTPCKEGQRLIVRTAVGYNGAGEDRWTTDGAYPAVGIHPETIALLPDRMRPGESLEFVACRAPYSIVGTLVTVTGGLVWSMVPGSRWALPEYFDTQAPAGNSPYVQLQKDVTQVEVPDIYTWGQPLRIVIGDASLAVEEGDRVVCRVFSTEVDTLVDGIHLRETASSTADLPGSLDQSLLTPFDVRFTWQRVDGEILLISREIVQEGSSLPLSASRLKVRTTAAQTADLTLTGSGGYVAKTGEFTAGSFALATHRIVIHARSGVSRSLSLEMLARFSYNGTTYTKVAESILYSDLVNVPAGQMSVAINGANDNNLRIEVTSTVAETIDWNAEVQSTYS